MPTCSIVISTFGSDEWQKLAAGRAYESARQQGDYDVILFHDPNPSAILGRVRNQAAGLSTSDYLCFLDGDDELEPGYIDACMQDPADVCIPRIRCLRDGPNEYAPPDPFFIDERPILEGNYIIVGAPIRRTLFTDIGGFSDDDYCEDWTLWIKATLAGAKFKLVPGAVYRQNWRQGSRNQPDLKTGEQIRQQIRNRYTTAARKAGLI